MKLLIEKQTLACEFVFEDEKPVTEQDDCWIVGDPKNPETVIWSKELKLVNADSFPDNFKPQKYKYVDNEWILNPFYLPTE